MSWRNGHIMGDAIVSDARRRPFGKVGRAAVMLALLAGAGLTLSGCGGVRPLYGTSASGESTKAMMAAVEIAPIPGRVGQRVRNELIFDTTGGGAKAPSRYTLKIVLREKVTKEMVLRSGDATGEVVTLDAQYQLVNKADNQVLKTGVATGRAAYDRYDKTFSNVRAQYNAQDRAADTIAESIRTQVAAFLATSA